MRATLSLAGMTTFQPTLFDDMVFPDSLDRDTIIDNILLETMELEVMISSGPIMQKALGLYSKAMLPSWERYVEALAADYDPLASDDTTETRSSSGNTTGQNTGSDSTTREVTGFNSGSLQTADKTTTQLGSGNTVSTQANDSTTRAGRAGRDPQDMIAKELDISTNNAIMRIVNDVKQKFCLLVY